MKGKIAFVVGLAVGYVFGTRAGRQRYEQIKAGARTVWDSTLVRRGRRQLNAYTADLRGTVQDSVLESGRAFINALIDRQKAHNAKPQSSASSAPRQAPPAPRAEPATKPAASPKTATQAKPAAKPKAKPAAKPTSEPAVEVTDSKAGA